MINKIVTNLDVSRKLKDWGIVQESVFYWWNVNHPRNDGRFFVLRLGKDKESNRGNYISAWTVTELGVMMDAVGINPNPNIAWGAIPNQIADGDYTIDEINQNLLSWRANDKG